jgi:hypothetical protein
MDVQNYFVIQKQIKDIWDDWIVFNEQIKLEEVLKIFDSKADKINYRVIRRTDKALGGLNQS